MFVVCLKMHLTREARVLQKAAELQAQEEAGREEFNFGVSLYERGRYADSESMLLTALDISGACPWQSACCVTT